MFRLLTSADKRSALYMLEHSHLIIIFLAVFGIYLIWNVWVLAFEIVITFLSNNDLAQKFTRQLHKFGVLVSLIVAMLYIQTPDQFELLATLISFALIFQFLMPNGLYNLIMEMRSNAFHKWTNKKHKNKK